MPKKNKMTSASFEVILEKIISSETLSTQKSIVNALKRSGVQTPNQSTVSRTLAKLGVSKIRDPRTGELIYRWPPKKAAITPNLPTSVKTLVRDVVANENTIVILTDPGSAPLVARYLDVHKPAGILGTIAGDDAIFVAPRSNLETRTTLQQLKRALGR
jgi:transcriptional regulator of arginine metabolism